MKLLIRVLMLCILFLSSCNSEEDKRLENNTYQVISLLIDEFGSPIKPPPPPEGKDAYFTEVQTDSIMNQIQTIGVHCVMKREKVDKNILEKANDKEYKDLLELFNNFNQDLSLDLSKIKSKKDYKVIYIDSTLSKQEQHNTYDWQLSFSRIAFDDNLKKALITVSKKHSGYFLCLLEKQDNEWFTKQGKMIYIY